MKEMTRKDWMLLARKLEVAKIRVFMDAGFSDEDIANVLGISLTGLHRIMDRNGIKRESE